jgi:hypothetical protein
MMVIASFLGYVWLLWLGIFYGVNYAQKCVIEFYNYSLHSQSFLASPNRLKHLKDTWAGLPDFLQQTLKFQPSNAYWIYVELSVYAEYSNFIINGKDTNCY